MANNLFISYDLNSPGQDYPEIIDAIKNLGNWAKVQKSLWYVNSTLTAQKAVEILRLSIDRNDSLIVIDATNNQANWYGVSDDVAKYIIDQWNK